MAPRATACARLRWPPRAVEPIVGAVPDVTAPLLSYTSVYERGVPYPRRWALVLHGILGTKSNWRAQMRRVVAQHPEWGALLVDLRNHGESRGFLPPHTLAAGADDLARLVASLDLRIDAVIGHSYGGKVAMAYARAVRGALSRLVVVDSTPSARPEARGSEETLRIVRLLEELRGVFAKREDFVEALLSRGLTRDLATWLAMNLERVPGEGAGYRFGIDVGAVRAMLDDYFLEDLWEVVEAPPGRMRVEMIVGERSTVLDASDRARLAAAALRQPARVRAHIVAGAGHWVHVDAPDATIGLLAESLGSADDVVP
jgi:pimeloyl-ACP methyl ester carboxylesterase